MNILEIIEKKRDNLELDNKEIEFFIKEYVNSNIEDYQAAALIMAIYINGMTEKEATDLTLAMANSGEILDLSSIRENIVDKHSTGGVGDKITLILGPIIASLGIPVAKMSGRGLGFTGGTRDKLESIPGYNTDISIEDYIKNVNEIGISLIGQSLNLAPADKKIYALRDAISCTNSIPLIASSIMSKKIASGANKIVLDVTVGKGAFMENKEDAIRLSKMMIDIGRLSNKETVCILTNMNEPLGNSVGNVLEIIETIDVLKGNMSEDIKEVVTELGSYMMKLAGKGNDIEENKKRILENIYNNRAYEKFIELVKKQGGDISYIEDISKFKKAEYILPVYSDKEGYINSLNAKIVGELSSSLGAGRIRKEDEIDPAVGIILNKKTGDKVIKNEIIAYIHSNNKEKGAQVSVELQKAYEISNEKTEKEKSILEVIY